MVLEVGIGGEYDSTNVIEKPVVCGITALGLDHVSVLGETLDKIAWHKAGIMKVCLIHTLQKHVFMFTIVATCASGRIRTTAGGYGSHRREI